MFICNISPEKKSYYAFAYFADSSNFVDYLPVVEQMAKSCRLVTKHLLSRKRINKEKSIDVSYDYQNATI